MSSARKFGTGACLLLASFLCTVGVADAASRVDSSFGHQGRIVANLSQNEVSRGADLWDFRELPDRSFTVSVKPEARRDPLSLLKFSRDGSSDGSFGASGVRRMTAEFTVTTPTGTIVAGTIGKGMPGRDVALRRLEPNGSPDRSFGRKGLVRIDFGAQDGPGQIVIGSTGEILVSAGFYCHASQNGCGYTWGGFGLALLSADGRLIRKARGESDSLRQIVAADDGSYRLTGFEAMEDANERTGLFRIDRQLKITEVGRHDETPDWSGPIAMLPGNGFYAFATAEDGAESVVRILPDGTIDPRFPPVDCPEPAPSPGLSEKQLAIDAKGRLLARGVGACDLMRILPSGDLDPSFGDGGIVKLFDQYERPRWTLTPTADGQILIAEWRDELGRLRIRRLTEAGQPDPSFPTRVVPVRQPSRDVARAVVRVGGYVVAGNSSCEGHEPWSSTCRGFFLAGYKANGKPNRSFGTNGFVRGGFMRINAIARTPDGALIAAGSTTRRTGPWNAQRTDLALARFSTDGELDREFGDDGLAVAEIPGDLDGSQALALLVRRDGRIVVTGEVDYKQRNTYPALPVLRYTPDGQPDRTFGAAGLAMIGAGRLGKGQAIALAGQRLLIGTMKDFREPAVVALRADGSLDPTFGHRAIAIPRLSVRARFGKPAKFTPFREVKTLKVLPSGGILAAAADGYGQQDGAVFKLKPDGKVDRRFGRRGAFYTGGLAGDSLARDRCGRITVAGTFRPRPHSGRTFGATVVSADGRIERAFARQRFAFPFGHQRPSWGTASASGSGRTVIVGSVKRELTAEDMAVVGLKAKRRCR